MTCVLQGDTIDPPLFTGYKNYSLQQPQKLEHKILQFRASDLEIQMDQRRDRALECNVTDEKHSSLISPVCPPAEVQSLHEACRQGKLVEVRRLLCRGLVSVNCRNDTGSTAVMAASEGGKNDIFDFLVQLEADPAAVDNTFNTVLHYACSGGNVQIVRTLFDNQTSGMERSNMKGEIPLMYAVREGHIPVVQFLEKKGVYLKAKDYYQHNILHKACIGGHVEMVKYVLSLNIIDMESKGQFGETPVMKAAYHGHVPVVELLKTRGVVLNPTDRGMDNILHVACNGGHIDMVKYVLSLNISDIESRGQFGRTPLMKAVSGANIHVVRLLHQHHGASLTATDDLGSNVFHVACESGYLKMVQYLSTLKELLGFEKKKNGNKNTPLSVAQNYGCVEIETFLKARL